MFKRSLYFLLQLELLRSAMVFACMRLNSKRTKNVNLIYLKSLLLSRWVNICIFSLAISVTRKNIAKFYKSWSKMISLEKWYILTHLQKLPKNVGDLGKLIAAKGFEKLPKLQKIAQSVHKACHNLRNNIGIEVNNYFFNPITFNLVYNSAKPSSSRL